MNLPPGYTEQRVLEAIEKAVTILAPSFVFGYYDLDDIKQEARTFGLQCLDKYDVSRPLENFVYTHIRNRLINLRRDKLRRNDAPCEKCHNGTTCNEGHYCEKYQVWLDRNLAKANIMRPLDLNYISDEGEHKTKLDSTVCEDVEIQELCRLVDEKLPVDLRAAFLQMRAGVSLPKAKRQEVELAVKEILGCPPNPDE